MSTTAVIARNVTWSGSGASEPYEAGWAETALIFVRALRPAEGRPGIARVEISPDGMHWVAEGTEVALPAQQDAIAFARIRHFGNWLRLAYDFPDASALRVLVTLHLKG